MDSDRHILPAHIEDTVRSIAELHAEHDRQASLYQRYRTTDPGVGRPAAVAIIGTIVILWIGTNVVLLRLRGTAFDPPRFPIC